jgi:hypothetical protein
MRSAQLALINGCSKVSIERTIRSGERSAENYIEKRDFAWGQSMMGTPGWGGMID